MYKVIECGCGEEFVAETEDDDPIVSGAYLTHMKQVHPDQVPESQ